MLPKENSRGTTKSPYHQNETRRKLQAICQLLPKPNGSDVQLQRRRGRHLVHQWPTSHSLILQASGEA